MLNLREIHKPTTLEDAIKFLRQPDTVAMAGGTQLIADQKKNIRAVVDLSALGLSYIRERDGAMIFGAMTTLAEVNDSPIVRAAANGVLAQAAHRTAASLLRNQGTVAGTIISEPNGIFNTALLALDARIVCVGEKEMDVALTDFLAMMDHFTMGGLVTEIIIPAASLTKHTSLQTVARTPRDQPIVCVCASARVENKIAHDVLIALGGVAWSAVRAGETEKELEGKTLGDLVIERAARLASNELKPRGDYRGSVAYRKEMAMVLTRRAMREL